MNPTETTLTITLTGELADWLKVQAERNVRTTDQHAEYLLKNIKHRLETALGAREERKAKREALGFPSLSKKAA